MASCAACHQPLLNSQRFLLEGTEVFHAACVGRAYMSKLRVAEQRVRELEAQVADTRRAAARVEAETNRLRNESTSRAAEVCVLEGRLSGARAELELTNERLRARQDELQGARNQNIALRAELAKVQVAEVQPEPEKEADPTSVRFGLLELD
jgi:chromosome segregation ATPase